MLFVVLVIENIIVGNLHLKADPTFGGGSLNVTGIYIYVTYIYLT